MWRPEFDTGCPGAEFFWNPELTSSVPCRQFALEILSMPCRVRFRWPFTFPNIVNRFSELAHRVVGFICHLSISLVLLTCLTNSSSTSFPCPFLPLNLTTPVFPAFTCTCYSCGCWGSKLLFSGFHGQHLNH